MLIGDLLPRSRDELNHKVASTTSAVGFISRHRERERQRFEEMRAARSNRLRRAQKNYLGLRSVGLWAAYESLKRFKRADEITLDELTDLADRLDFWAPCSEPIRVHQLPKPNGGTREISIFGPERRAMDIAVARILEARFEPHPAQYGVPGRGRARAVSDIVAALQTHERRCTHAICADVRDAFNAVDWEEARLPVPAALIANVLGDGSSVSSSYPSIHILTPTLGRRQRRLRQGAAVSQMAATMVLRSLPELLPTAAMSFLYVDDYLGLAGSPQEADALATALEQAIGALPGRLRPKEVGTYDVRQGFDFLGFRFQRSDSGVKVTPSARAFERLLARCLERAHRGDTEEEIAAYVVAWRRSFELAELDEEDEAFLATVPKEAVLMARQTAA